MVFTVCTPPLKTSPFPMGVFDVKELKQCHYPQGRKIERERSIEKLCMWCGRVTEAVDSGSGGFAGVRILVRTESPSTRSPWSQGHSDGLGV